MISANGTEDTAAPAPDGPVELPRLVRFGRDYWLSRCRGFRVDAAGGRRWHVGAVLFGSRLDRPDFLVIRQGALRPRRATVPVDDVVEIDPPDRRLRLALLDLLEPSRQGRDRWWRRAWSSLHLAS
jgi:hypothetical protein